MAREFQELMEYRYGDRGGYKVLEQIYQSNTTYDHKLNSIKEQYRVSRDTASRWYRMVKNVQS